MLKNRLFVVNLGAFLKQVISFAKLFMVYLSFRVIKLIMLAKTIFYKSNPDNSLVGVVHFLFWGKIFPQFSYI